MKVVIINCFDTWQNRVDFVSDYFTDSNAEVTVITSDFKHREKKRITEKKDNYLYISVPEYCKNISLGRIYSHYVFAKKSFWLIEKNNIKPDVLYVLIPPNFLSFLASRFKKKHDCKLILDVIDMWPESLLRTKYASPFIILWKKLREVGFKSADKIICECEYYKKEFIKEFQNLDFSTVYFGKKSNGLPFLVHKLEGDILRFCWLGSINSLIDITKICDLFSGLLKYKKVEFEIIGNGEKLQELITAAERVGCVVHSHGTLFDEKIKHEIMSKCHFALNIMKPTVAVGLTMKSVDYLENGLPLINTIPGDTFDFVNDAKIGFNYKNLNKVVEQIISLDNTSYQTLCQNSRNLWQEKIAYGAIKKNLQTSLVGLL